ncbi:DNA-directed RNA polymerase I subunit RPA49-like isoform X1 [Gigantopelta aegis]|uniref:DNA-directed RNA polymerase I subunit RPA49-like isoform X1 n=1 Tax=Gigantopelta aegis TaxID=1735272 RepID=UPI001B88AA59|nr:DNA-directed RNA polymerase I subunit RPA49-like isoform X1 [Gigantopelta aegis]
MTTISVDVERKNGKTVVADFSSTGKLKGKAHTKLRLGHFCNSNTSSSRKRSQQIVVGESNKIYYVGKNFGEGAQGLQGQCKYYVGIVNEVTGKMSVCDAEIFKMQPVLKDGPAELVFDEDQSNMSFREKADLLTTAFGSAKQKKGVTRRLQTQVKGDSFEKSLTAAADRALKEGGSKLLAGMNKNVNEVTTIPPCNRDAEFPEYVYNLDDIISPGEMEALTDPAKTFYDSTQEQIKQWEQAKSCPQFVLTRLAYLPLNEEARWWHSKCLLFMKYLCRLYLVNAKQMNKIYEIFPDDCPDMVKTSLLNRFTLLVEGTNKKKPVRCMSAWVKDKLAYYILVLGLIIDHFSTDLQYFQKDLRIGQKKLLILYQMLGCKITKQKDPNGVQSNDTYIATLSIPLQPMLDYKVKASKSKKYR